MSAEKDWRKQVNIVVCCQIYEGSLIVHIKFYKIILFRTKRILHIQKL